MRLQLVACALLLSAATAARADDPPGNFLFHVAHTMGARDRLPADR
jgi:hypothetical protein